MTDGSSDSMCTICQCKPTLKELERNSKYNYNNIVRCVLCRNLFHFSCLEKHFKHLDDGKETCPLCRHDLPILHPGSSKDKQQKFTNQLLSLLIERRSQETTARLTAVAEQEANLDPHDDIQRIADELKAAVQAEAESAMLSSFHPPLRTARDRSDPMWKAAVRRIKLDPSTLSEGNPLAKLELEVFFEFRLITTRLIQALDGGESEEDGDMDGEGEEDGEMDDDAEETEEFDDEDEETEEFNEEDEDTEEYVSAEDAEDGDD